MSKYKVGDYVIFTALVTDYHYTARTIGKPYKITEVLDSTMGVILRITDDDVPRNGMDSTTTGCVEHWEELAKIKLIGILKKVLNA